MNEYQRMQYLDAMGIEMFVPRKRLLGARASVALKVAQPAAIPDAINTPQPPANSQHLAEVVAIPVEHRQNKTQLADHILDQLIAPTASHPPPVKNTSLPAGNQIVRFSLSLWSHGDWLIIDTHQPHQALPTDVLLHNIFISLHQPAALPKADVVNWPVIESPGAPGDINAAREMMSGFLQTRLARQPIAHILLMGDAAYQTCAPEPGDFNEVMFSRVTISHTKTLVLPSLTQLLLEPGLKAQVWQLLTQSDA